MRMHLAWRLLIDCAVAWPWLLLCRYEVLEDTEEGRQALGLTPDAAGTFPAASDMYMPFVEPDSPLSGRQEQQHQQQAALPSPQQHGMVRPRGLGLGLGRRAGPLPGLRQQQQTLQMLQDADMPADPMVTSPAAAATGTAGQGSFAGPWDVDESAAMAVDAATSGAAGIFVDAVQIGLDDPACEGLPVGLGPTAGPFIHLQGVGSGGLGGAFEAVHLPHVAGAAAPVDDEMQVSGPGLMQLHYNS